MLPDFLSEIEQYNIRQARPKPGRCALMVIDMQQYFLSIAKPILGNILSVIEAFRSVGIWTVFTRHGHKDVSKDGGMPYKWWGDLIDGFVKSPTLSVVLHFVIIQRTKSTPHDYKICTP